MASPIIQVTPQFGVSLLVTLPTRMRTTSYGVTSGGWRGVKHYGPDGRLHTIRDLIPPHPFSALQRLLAATFLNPALVAEVHYEDPTTYALSELIDTLIHAVQEDDDILTQWRRPDDLSARLRAAESFEDCVATLQYAGLTPEPMDAA